ncbi:hypothetical protein [Streptomyces atratus]|uniref:hypothetical protein n=1 Tax=Streptomyces atratus TaxID=1893 RepID=UPI002F91851B
MSNIYRNLPPEERAEYDDLFHSAAYDEDGKQLPAHEIKKRAHTLLQEAAAAGKVWASYVIDDDARDGHLRRFKQWDRARQVVHTKHGDRVVRRSAVMSLRRKNAETGQLYYQGTFYDDMTRNDLLDVISESGSRISADRDTIETARRLLHLVDDTRAATVSQALKVRGLELESYLMGECA